MQELDEKIIRLENILKDLRESAANETKSTAGDKYETALAMLQIEQANTSVQLQEAKFKKESFLKIDTALSPNFVAIGSLVKTNKGFFYLAEAIGKISVDGMTITSISLQSPLGRKLIGLKVGCSIVVNESTFIIDSIQ